MIEARIVVCVCARISLYRYGGGGEGGGGGEEGRGGRDDCRFVVRLKEASSLKLILRELRWKARSVDGKGEGRGGEGGGVNEYGSSTGSHPSLELVFKGGGRGGPAYTELCVISSPVPPLRF